MIDPGHLDLLRQLGTAAAPHSGRTFLEHLTGTHDLLERWGNDPAVCAAGLFHSIYGTSAYELRSADLANRARIAGVIGWQAEELAFHFCTTDRRGFFTEAGQAQPTLRARTDGAPVAVSVATIGALIEIEVANCIEQIQPDIAPRRQARCMRQMLEAGRALLTPAAAADFARFVARMERASGSPWRLVLGSLALCLSAALLVVAGVYPYRPVSGAETAAFLALATGLVVLVDRAADRLLKPGIVARFGWLAQAAYAVAVVGTALVATLVGFAAVQSRTF
jgi:hypothetical protein